MIQFPNELKNERFFESTLMIQVTMNPLVDKVRLIDRLID